MGTLTVDQIEQALWYTDHSRWTGSVVTFSLPTSTSVWPGYRLTEEPFDPKYATLNADQQVDFVTAVALWDRVVDISLVQAPDNVSAAGQIRIAFTDVAAQLADGSDPSAYAYGPPPPGFGVAPFEGDIWFSAAFKDADSEPGTFFFATMLHELGHALGLKHPFEGPATLPAEFDNTRFTVMSYTDFPDSTLRYFTLDQGKLYAHEYTVEPITPMVLDIVALQGLYGPARDTATGDSTYALPDDNPVIYTIVDDGGNDTFDLTANVHASRVDLTPGAFSSIGLFSIEDQVKFWQAQFPNFSASDIRDFLNQPDTFTNSNNVAISLDTVIENVKAGAGDDTIQGNLAANMLSGGDGSDRIFGGLGNDTIDGGAAGPAGNYLRGDEGNDSIVGGSGFDDANGNMGNDTIATGDGDDYCVGGRDNDVLSGGGGYDLVYGNLGDDTCDGGTGNDIVRGGQGNDSVAGGDGNDFVSGDKGDDTMAGGAGADVFHSFADAGIDRVIDFHASEGDRVQLDPGTVFQVMQVGSDTVIQMSAGQMILVGVSMSSLPAGTIFGA